MKHNINYIKRNAKKIKKERNITHHQALNIAAENIGFNNWKHFLHSNNDPSSNNNSTIKISLENRKVDPYRNLLIAAINKLIEGKHISLNVKNINQEEEKGYIFLNLFEHNSVITWHNIGHQELSISVWWKYNHNNHPQANLKGSFKESFDHSKPLAKKSSYKRFVGVVANCWLERKNGKYIQGKNRKGLLIEYTRRGELENLKRLPAQKPTGYESSGLFYN